MSIFQMII